MTVQTRAGTPYPRCGLPRRLVAIAYDTVIIIGLLLIAAAVASPFDTGGQQAFRDPFFSLYLLAVWFFYFSLCWLLGGMTVGMRAWRIILIADKGSWKLCVYRFLGALVSFAFAGLGLLWSLADPEKRCWQDISSHSGLYEAPRTRAR